MEYLRQMKGNATLNTSELDDDNQYKYIHNDTYFFATLFENTLNIAKSKKVSFLFKIYTLIIGCFYFKLRCCKLRSYISSRRRY